MSKVPRCVDCDEPSKCAIMGCGTAAVVRHFGWRQDELTRHPYERHIAFAVSWELTEREREVARLAYNAGRESVVRKKPEAPDNMEVRTGMEAADTPDRGGRETP